MAQVNAAKVTQLRNENDSRLADVAQRRLFWQAQADSPEKTKILNLLDLGDSVMADVAVHITDIENALATDMDQAITLYYELPVFNNLLNAYQDLAWYYAIKVGVTP